MEKSRDREKVSLTGRLMLRIFCFHCWSVRPAPDPEKLPISEHLCSHLWKALALLSGSLAGKLPSISLELGSGWGSSFLYFFIYPFNKFLPSQDPSESLFFVPKLSNCQWPAHPFPRCLEHIVSWHPWRAAYSDHPVESSQSQHQVPLYFLQRTYHQLMWSLY